jgi:4,5-DOPA dioxygenase extradiol
MRRREFLKAAVAAPIVAACSTPSPRSNISGPMPAIFVAHGSPLLLEDEIWVKELTAWSDALPTPRAILVLSAHWEAKPLTLGATSGTEPLLFDFGGFPDHHYRVKYAPPGAPGLADLVQALVTPVVGEVWGQKHRGLDHGAYVPLVAMYPNALIPVLQMSLPSLEPKELFALGRALAPLRDDNVLIMGSGFLTHNIFEGYFDAPRDVVKEAWASEFDHWCAEVLAKRDVDALLDYKRRAPAVGRAHPSHEHFAPVITALGASIDKSDAATAFPIRGWMAGTFTRRSAQFG